MRMTGSPPGAKAKRGSMLHYLALLVRTAEAFQFIWGNCSTRLYILKNSVVWTEALRGLEKTLR